MDFSTGKFDTESRNVTTLQDVSFKFFCLAPPGSAAAAPKTGTCVATLERESEAVWRNSG